VDAAGQAFALTRGSRPKHAASSAVKDSAMIAAPKICDWSSYARVMSIISSRRRPPERHGD